MSMRHQEKNRDKRRSARGGLSHTAIELRARVEQKLRLLACFVFNASLCSLSLSPLSPLSLTLSSFVLKYSPTSSNDASAQLAGQSEPTSTEGAARHFEEEEAEERCAAKRAATAAALLSLLLARARGAGRTDVRQRAEDISSGA